MCVSLSFEDINVRLGLIDSNEGSTCAELQGLLASEDLIYTL